jgi:serine phosphatase RsbU (regulator of sigma subunit)
MIADERVDDDQPLLLADDPVPRVTANWKLLIVDDEPAIHGVTIMVLSGLRFRDRGLTFLSAHSSAEAQRVLAENPDIALILLDVVMESDDAGLKLVRFIRDELHNELVRIILRTGQPGQAPERQVILEYDINDYKEKTELTAQKLSTAVVAALRGYMALLEVAALNHELEGKVAQRTRELELSNAKLKKSLAALEQGERAGRRVQFKLLPQQGWRFGGYEFSHLLMPSEFMSGDFVDYFAIDEQRVGFYIADVSGHGVASAFVTVYLKRFVSTAIESFRQGKASAIDDPAQLLQQLNHELLRENVGKHIAIFYGIVDIAGHKLRSANAGAVPYPLLADSQSTRYLVSRSTPVGLFDSSQYLNQTLALPDRFRLLLCSDGVLEVMSDTAADARIERLRRSLSHDVSSLDVICERLAIQPSGQLPDDLTMLMIGRD